MSTDTLRVSLEDVLRDFDPTPRQNDPTWQEMTDAAISVVLREVEARINAFALTAPVDWGDANELNDILDIIEDLRHGG